MKLSRVLLLSSLMGLVCAQSGMAASQDWHSDDHGSVALLAMDHAGMFDFHFLLPRVSGQARIDDADPARSSLRFSIDVASLLAGNAEVRQRVTGPDLLDAPQYPSIDFVSERIAPRGRGAIVTGALTLRGQTHRVSFNLEPRQRISEFRGTRFRGMTLNGVINRRDFGIDYRDADRPASAPQQYGDQLKLNLVLELVDRAMPGGKPGGK